MKEKNVKMKKDNWILIVLVSTFVLSLLFSYLSSTVISNLNLIPSILFLILVILIGILFDLIGVAVTVGNEEHFHAQASKRIKGSKVAIKMIRNSSKVANFCADVIGDICGVLSGAIAAVIALKMSEYYGLSSNAQFIVSALVAALTVSGKAISKNIAQKRSTEIIGAVSRFISFGEKDNKNIK